MAWITASERQACLPLSEQLTVMPPPFVSRLEAIGAVAAGTTFRVAKIPYHAVQEKQAYEENLEILQTHAAVFPTGADLKVEPTSPASFVEMN